MNQNFVEEAQMDSVPRVCILAAKRDRDIKREWERNKEREMEVGGDRVRE